MPDLSDETPWQTISNEFYLSQCHKVKSILYSTKRY